MSLPHLAVTFLIIVASQAALAWKPEIGEIPSEISSYDYVDESLLSLEALRGSPVVLYFGADWCAPCQKARPVVAHVAKTYADLGLKVVFISSDDNYLRDAKRVEEVQLGFRIAMPKLSVCPIRSCPSGTASLGAFGRVYTYPSAVLIDRAGVVADKLERGEGVSRGLESAVKALLAR